MKHYGLVEPSPGCSIGIRWKDFCVISAKARKSLLGKVHFGTERFFSGLLQTVEGNLGFFFHFFHSRAYPKSNTKIID